MIIWYENFKYFRRYCKSPADVLAVWALLSPVANGWLDRIHLKSNRSAYKVGRGCLRSLKRIAHFNQLIPPLGGLTDICKLYRRLNGIYSCGGSGLSPANLPKPNAVNNAQNESV